MKYFIESDLKSFNQNNTTNASRGNKFYANKKKKESQYMIILQFRQQNITKIKTPCKINVIWHAKDKRMDLDNLLLKNVLDALQCIEMLKNDNLNHVVEINSAFVVDKEKQGLEIEFVEV
jgi:Holliday junction resolvase RusA-like endonuclease